MCYSSNHCCQEQAENTTHPLSGSLQYLFGYIGRGLDKWAFPTKSNGGKACTTPSSHHHFVNWSSQSFLRIVFGFLTYRFSFPSPSYALCMPTGSYNHSFTGQTRGRCLAQGFSGRLWCCRELEGFPASQPCAGGSAALPCWECPQMVGHRVGKKRRIITWEGVAEKYPPSNNKGFKFA